MTDHTKLRAFELADELVLLVYRFTKSFPASEQFGPTSSPRMIASAHIFRVSGPGGARILVCGSSDRR